jgi:hypothetical protein
MTIRPYFARGVMLVLVTDNLWVANKFVEKAAEPLNPSPRHDFHLERQLPSAFLLDDGKPACSEFEVRFEEIAIDLRQARFGAYRTHSL